MNKRILTPLFLLTCLSFSACGKKTVKVTLKGDDHLTWEKTEDKAEVSKDYVVKAIPEKGYLQYEDTLTIYSGTTPLSLDAKQYKFDESSQTLTIYKGNIFGDLSIESQSEEGNYTISYVYSTDYYQDFGTTDYVTITHPNIEKIIKPISGKTIKTEDVHVSPENVKYSYTKDGDNGKLVINKSEFYRNITITLPNL